MSIISAFRGVAAVALALCLCRVSLVHGEPAHSVLAASGKQFPLEILLADIPHIGVEEVRTLSPRDQEMFVVLVLDLVGKYKAGITPLPGRFVNMLETDEARLREC